ncbi:MAG: hypothetical protein QOK29_2497, partial [Rhodospirillaceae bacterium]|nr:hypothetical protein [Rhodospirillaceae bacterium]
LRLQAILEQCRLLSTRRNELLHGLFAAELDGEEVFRAAGLRFRPAPKMAELDELAADLETVTGQLNTARLDGFLSEAIAATKQKGRGRASVRDQ